MPLPVIANTIRASVYGTCEGGVGMSNTFHIVKDNAASYANAMADCAATIAQMYSAAGFGGTNFGWAHYANSGSKINQIVQTPLDGTTPSRSDSVAISGTGATDALPAQTALLITLRTAIRGRSFRGRVFWGGLDRGTMGPDGRFPAADVAFVEAAWTAFNTALVAQTRSCALTVASYHLVLETAVSGFTCRTVYGHQTRRRGRGA